MQYGWQADTFNPSVDMQFSLHTDPGGSFVTKLHKFLIQTHAKDP